MKKKIGIKPRQDNVFGEILDDVKADVKEGIRLRDEAIQQALHHAESVNEGWTRTAFKYLISYMRINYKFTTEEIRIAAEGTVDVPPDTRSWGGIIKHAAEAGFIKKIGVKSGLTKQCHRGPKTVWQVSDIFFHKAGASEGEGTKTKKVFSLQEMIEFGNFMLRSKHASSMNEYFSSTYGIDINAVKQKTKPAANDN